MKVHGHLPYSRCRVVAALAGLIPVATVLFKAAPAIAAADPLDTWHVRVPPLAAQSADFEGVAYGNGRWVVVSQTGTILSSPDGAEWTEETNPAGPGKLNDVCFGAGTFVAIGSGNGVVLTSPDGRQWSRQSPKSGGGMEIIHDGTRFVVLAAGGFLSTSGDGVDWEAPAPVPTLYVDVGGIAFGNGTYVEAGYTRTGKPTDLWSSVGLTDWQFRDAKSSQNLMGVGYGLGQFVAVGQKGTLLTSPDGVEWTPREVPHTGFIWDVCDGAGYLAAASQWGRVLTSANGTDWTRRETGVDSHLTDIAFGNGTFMAVGWDGQIVQSDPLAPVSSAGEIVLSQPRTAANEDQFTFTGEVGGSYQVQATSDWTTWSPVANVTCTASPMKVSVANLNGTARFYRVVKP